MARLVELHPAGKGPALSRSVRRDNRLCDQTTYDVENALSARNPQEEEWRDAKRQYNAIPRQPYRSTPVPNAPNIEVPLGAIAVDAQYAAITDTLYSASPVLTARALDEPWVPHAKAVQRWVNYCAEHEFGLREATDHTFFDTCQLGTGGFYVPFVEDIYKHKVFNMRFRGPRILPIEPQNIIVPGGSRGDIQRDEWVAIRHWLTPAEMRLRARKRGWDMSKAMPTAEIDWVRRRHELLGLTNSSNNWRELYEVFEFFRYYDYNEDGEDLDLHVFWDRSSRKVLEMTFNPYDERPIVPTVYQVRPHLFYGLGIMAMLRPMQEEATEIHNHRTLNMMIANARIWIAEHGVFGDSTEVWANKVIEAANINAVKELKMGDVYPSSLQGEVSVTSLAERRVGMEGGAGGQAPRNLGTRTPGITALTSVQQQNKRFTPAFDSMRLGACEAMRQGLLRQRERLQLGDAQVAGHIREVLGRDDGDLVIELLRQPNFHRYVQVEFTAVSASTNREADRQSAVLMANTATQYYSQIVQMVTAALNPQAPPEMVTLTREVATKASELFERFLRTFDQMRDPKAFVLQLDDTFNQMEQNRRAGLGGMAQMLAQSAPGGAPQNGTPQGNPLDTSQGGA